MLILISILIVNLFVLYLDSEVHNARLGRDVWDWAHKLSKWLKTKGY